MIIMQYGFDGASSDFDFSGRCRGGRPGEARPDAAVMEGATGDVRTGTAVSLLQHSDFDASTACYLCGPPPMVNAARKTLMSFGVAASAIRAERFQPGG